MGLTPHQEFVQFCENKGVRLSHAQFHVTKALFGDSDGLRIFAGGGAGGGKTTILLLLEDFAHKKEEEIRSGRKIADSQFHGMYDTYMEMPLEVTQEEPIHVVKDEGGFHVETPEEMTERLRAQGVNKEKSE